jgi:hypothetical protein
MDKILTEMLGKDAELSLQTLLMRIVKLEKRVEELENKNSYGGVFIDGSPSIVKDYYAKIIEEEKKKGGVVNE